MGCCLRPPTPRGVAGDQGQVIVAAGWGSQFIHLVPALEAVIVTTGGNHFNGKTFTVGEVLLRELAPGVELRPPPIATSPS